MNIFNITPQEVANQVIDLYLKHDLTQEQAEKAALEAISLALSIGVYPAFHPNLKKAENLLNKKLLK